MANFGSFEFVNFLQYFERSHRKTGLCGIRQVKIFYPKKFAAFESEYSSQGSEYGSKIHDTNLAIKFERNNLILRYLFKQKFERIYNENNEISHSEAMYWYWYNTGNKLPDVLDFNLI